MEIDEPPITDEVGGLPEPASESEIEARAQENFGPKTPLNEGFKTVRLSDITFESLRGRELLLDYIIQR